MKMFLLFATCITHNFLFSQDCRSSYFLQQNKTVDLAIYNKRGDDNGMISYKILSVSAKGQATTGVVKSDMLDKTKKTISSSLNNVKCENGIMFMDMKLFLPQQQAEQFAKADTKAKNAYLEYPIAAKPGDQLKDGNFEIVTDKNGLKQTLKMHIYNRQVTGTQKITTAAGSWDCLVITYQTKLDMQTGPIAVPLTFDTTEWYAPGFGIVKSVGKNGSMELVAVR